MADGFLTSPHKPVVFPSFITRDVTPASSSMTRAIPAFQKYMGVPKNLCISFFTRAFFCPEAVCGESL